MKNNDKEDALLIIKSNLNALTKTERFVAEYVLKYANDVIYLSVTDLAGRVYVGETTVIRFCRKLGFKGFQDFKLSLAQDLVTLQENSTGVVEKGDAIGVFANKIIQSYNNTLEDTQKLINVEKYENALDLLNQADNIVFFGVGSSSLIAKLAVDYFIRIGKRCSTNSDTHFQAVSASLMTEKDVAVGISVSGSTKDTIGNLKLAKKSGAKVICITQNARSPITMLADVELLMSGRETPLQGSSLSSKISQMAVIDILNAGLAIRRGEIAQNYRSKTAQAVTDKLY